MPAAKGFNMIYYVEDDDNIRDLTVYALRKQGIEAEGFSCDGEFKAAVARRVPDAVLLDIMLPGMDGFAVLEHIRGESCETPVIFLTALGAVADKVKGLRGGAEDYIVKPFEPVELLARIEVVLRRAGKSEMHLRYGDIQVDIEKHTALKNGVPVALTPKEFDVLVFFMRNQDVAITREQLLSNIWGFDFTGESRSVDIHVQQVRRKMGLQGKLITIPKLGYRLERR